MVEIVGYIGAQPTLVRKQLAMRECAPAPVAARQ
jgi:hypothetical protein